MILPTDRLIDLFISFVYYTLSHSLSICISFNSRKLYFGGKSYLDVILKR